MANWRWIILLFALIVDAEGRETVDLIIVVECVHRFQRGAKPANPTEGVQRLVQEIMMKLLKERLSMRMAVVFTDDKKPMKAMDFNLGDDPYGLRGTVSGWKHLEPMVNTPIDDPLTDAVKEVIRHEHGDRPEVPNGVFFFGMGDPPRTTDHKPIFDQPWMSKVDAVFFLVSGFQLPTELCYRNMHSSEGMCSQFDKPTDAPEDMLEDIDDALDEMGRSVEEQSTESSTESMEGSAQSTNGSTEWTEGSAGPTESADAPRETGEPESLEKSRDAAQDSVLDTDRNLTSRTVMSTISSCSSECHCCPLSCPF